MDISRVFILATTYRAAIYLFPADRPVLFLGKGGGGWQVGLPPHELYTDHVNRPDSHGR